MTDADFLLSVLADGRAHTLNEILQRSFKERGCGLTVHSRAADLRKRGHEVMNETVPGARRGYGSAYRLISSPAAYSPRDVGPGRDSRLGTQSLPLAESSGEPIGTPAAVGGSPVHFPAGRDDTRISPGQYSPGEPGTGTIRGALPSAPAGTQLSIDAVLEEAV
jgi:hypothetical protein